MTTQARFWFADSEKASRNQAPTKIGAYIVPAGRAAFINPMEAIRDD
jgi:hypothetical protein